MTWIKVREYANNNDIALKNVYRHIKNGNLQAKKINGILHVAVDSDEKTVQPTDSNNQSESDKKYAEQLAEKLKLENALKLEKLKNLQQDTLIKKQKQVFTKQLYRQEYVQGVFECFTESFANIKNLIIDLKLSKENNQRFKKIFAECIKKFEQSLKKYLAEADKKELEQNEADKAE